MGRYSIALNKKSCVCNPNNPCSGKYGKTLDLKLTNKCNGKCPFCIEQGGYAPKELDDPKKMADIINAKDIKTLLVLGGEPLLYPKIIELLSYIRKDLDIFMTTNGSLLTPELGKALSPYLKGMNISLHHSTSSKNMELTKVELPEEGAILYKAIHAFGVDKVRINCNLVKGYVDSDAEVKKMIELCKKMGIKRIRFAELQNCPAMYVDARTIFPDLPDNPFVDGCEQEYKREDGITVTVRETCGITDPTKCPVINPVGRNAQTQIMYPNGQTTDRWVEQDMESMHGLSPVSNGCHGRNRGGLS
jgi:pyruvate-formate lyase-activating enzyme